jgi:hypothetical protein
VKVVIKWGVFILLFFACPKKSNKRKGTTLTNHKLLFSFICFSEAKMRTLRLVACRTGLRSLPQNLWFALSVDTRPQAMNAWIGLVAKKIGWVRDYWDKRDLRRDDLYMDVIF